jgi:hypothetical protein
MGAEVSMGPNAQEAVRSAYNTVLNTNTTPIMSNVVNNSDYYYGPLITNTTPLPMSDGVADSTNQQIVYHSIRGVKENEVSSSHELYAEICKLFETRQVVYLWDNMTVEELLMMNK